MKLRELKPREKGLLKDFLYEAIFIPEGMESSEREIIDQPKIWLMEKIEKQNNMALVPLHEYVKSSLVWEIERIYLIKRKCHEYDQEWRMIRIN